MKDKIQKKRKSSKLNGENTIKAINSQGVSLVRYSAEILKWTKDELNFFGQKNTK